MWINKVLTMLNYRLVLMWKKKDIKTEVRIKIDPANQIYEKKLENEETYGSHDS